MGVVPDLLFTGPIGLSSPFTILFIIGMTIALMVWCGRKTNHPEA